MPTTSLTPTSNNNKPHTTTPPAVCTPARRHRPRNGRAVVVERISWRWSKLLLPQRLPPSALLEMAVLAVDGGLWLF